VSEKKYGLWLGYLIAGLYGGWFFWIVSSNWLIVGLSSYIPGWLATLIWALWLILPPIDQGLFDVPVYFQVSLYVSYLISCMFFPISLHFYPVASVLIAGLVLVETQWLIPLWKVKWNRHLESQ
jgi:hypothetical protein